MGENKIENLFEVALNENQLSQFIVGSGKYYVLDREYDGHWPLGSYKLYVEPYLLGNSMIFPTQFWEQLIKTMERIDDKNIFVDFLIAYFIPYYSCEDLTLRDLRTKSTPQQVVEFIKNYLSANRDSLMNDKRGTGIEWNSTTGLWGGILDNLKVIKQRGGPDFIPIEN